MMMPEAVTSSAAVGWMRTLSANGLSFIIGKFIFVYNLFIV
jgi:hypothetical protein